MTYDKASFLAGLRTGLALPRVPKTKPPAAYLTFRSEDSSEFTLAVQNGSKNWDGTLYYSTDAKTWSVWNGSTAISSDEGVLYLRGTQNTRITGSYSVSCIWLLTKEKRIQCNGNIENLLDFEIVEAGEHPQMEAYCYYNMFYGCTSLTSAPELPATTLAYGCYGYMFYGCTSLTSAPELPATTLASNCYEGMFWGCTSLTRAPELPATTLADYCYNHMFSVCTSLMSAPTLPATTLSSLCYGYMFCDCTSLTSAPELPATTLAYGCYGYMFARCNSFKISTTQDSTYAYPYRIPTSGTGTDATYSLYGMFSATGGTFTGTPSINTVYYTNHPPIPAEQGGNHETT